MQREYDDQYAIWNGYDTLRKNLAAARDAVDAAELRLIEVDAELSAAEIANANAKLAQKLAEDALAAQTLVNDTQDKIDEYKEKAAEAEHRRDGAAAGSAEYLAAEKDLDDALRRGLQAKYTRDAAEYLAVATKAALDAFDAYLAALAGFVPWAESGMMMCVFLLPRSR